MSIGISTTERIPKHILMMARPVICTTMTLATGGMHPST